MPQLSPDVRRNTFSLRASEFFVREGLMKIDEPPQDDEVIAKRIEKRLTEDALKIRNLTGELGAAKSTLDTLIHRTNAQEATIEVLLAQMKEAGIAPKTTLEKERARLSQGMTLSRATSSPAAELAAANQKIARLEGMHDRTLAAMERLAAENHQLKGGTLPSSTSLSRDRRTSTSGEPDAWVAQAVKEHNDRLGAA